MAYNHGREDRADFNSNRRFYRWTSDFGEYLEGIRKQNDSDVFNKVSGTTGLTGSADATFVLEQENRASNAAKLYVTGRHTPYQEFMLRFRDCSWELVERKEQEQIERESITPTKRWTALPPKNCTVCGVEYVPGSAISKYCPICAKKVQREKSNESKRRSRTRDRQVCIELSAKNDRLIWPSEKGISSARATRTRWSIFTAM